MDNQSTGIGSVGNSVSVPSGAGFDSVDTSFESGVSQVHEVYPEHQAIPADSSLPENEDSEKIMNIPGTAHDKLQDLSAIKGESIDYKVRAINQKVENFSLTGESKLTFEQKIMMLQAETLKYLALSMNEKRNDKEKEKLLEKLKELMSEMGKTESDNKASLIGAVFNVMILLLNSAENGTKQLGKEVSRAQ